MSREEDKRKSLSFLGRIADQAAAPFPTAKPAPRPPPPPPRPPAAAPAPRKPTPAPARTPALSPANYEAERRRRAKMEERKAKLEEDRMLKQRRQNELHRNANLEWRGMDMGRMGTGVRRTAFDIVEPSTTQKIEDVLGAPKEKEGRAKNRDKGRRQSG